MSTTFFCFQLLFLDSNQSNPIQQDETNRAPLRTKEYVKTEREGLPRVILTSRLLLNCQRTGTSTVMI